MSARNLCAALAALILAAGCGHAGDDAKKTAVPAATPQAAHAQQATLDNLQAILALGGQSPP